MSRKSFILATILSLAVFSSGCFYLVLGSLGALGGYAVSSDTVQGTIERDMDDVWDASMDVAGVMGRVTKEIKALGQIEASINNARVIIHISKFTSEIVRLNVKARKSFFPSIATAQDVYIKIITKLGT